MDITVKSKFDSVLHLGMGIWLAIGQWFSIYLRVVTSLQNFGNYHVDMGLQELLKTLGFVGLFFLTYLTFIGKVPILPISEKHLYVLGMAIDQAQSSTS